MRLSRRQFLWGTSAFTTLAATSIWTTQTQYPKPNPLVDCHVHLFGTTQREVPVHNQDCWISPTQRRHVNYRFLLKLLHIQPDDDLNATYVDRLVSQLKHSSVTKAVLLAYDCRYDQQGKPDWAHTTSVYVPNTYLFRVVKQYPDLFTACPSLNPQRADWEKELDYCLAEGARVLKIHPPTQNVDPGDPRFTAFYRKCAASGMVVMVHTGTEHAAEITHDTLSDPLRLELPLSLGCTVIACHSGMSAVFDPVDFYPHLIGLVQKYPKLYCDTAILGAMFRWRCLPRMLRNPEVMERALYGSDFPLPANALHFWHRLHPITLAQLLDEQNLFERNFRLQQALGLPTAAFSRITKVLA